VSRFVALRKENFWLTNEPVLPLAMDLMANTTRNATTTAVQWSSRASRSRPSDDPKGFNANMKSVMGLTTIGDDVSGTIVDFFFIISSLFGGSNGRRNAKHLFYI
jgi:hypothetical protein